MVEITKWKLKYYPWLKQLMEHGPQRVIIWRKAASTTMSEEVIKGEFTLPGHRRSTEQPQETL